MAPNPQPLINSVKDLAEKKDVGLIVFKNFAPESQILVLLLHTFFKLSLQICIINLYLILEIGRSCHEEISFEIKVRFQFSLFQFVYLRGSSENEFKRHDSCTKFKSLYI